MTARTHAEDDARRHGDDRQLQGDHDAPEDRAAKRYLPDHAPLEAALAGPLPASTWEKNRVLTSMATSTSDHGAGHPAPRVADGDDLQRRPVRPARRPGGERAPADRVIGRAVAVPAGRPQLVAPLITERGDRPGLHAPLGQDLGVDAVGDEEVDRRLHRGGHAVALGEGQPVGGDLEGGAAVLEHAVGGGHDVAGHLGVGEADVGPAAGDGQVGLALVAEGEDGDRRLAGLGAGLGLGLGVGLLGGARLHRDRCGRTARLSPLKARRAAGLHVEALTGGEVVDEVDHLLPGHGVGERRGAHVVLAALDARDDGVEGGVDQLGLEAEHLADGGGQVGVHADDGRAVGGDELVRGVGGVHGDGEGALRLDRGGHGGRDARRWPAGSG